MLTGKAATSCDGSPGGPRPIFDLWVTRRGGNRHPEYGNSSCDECQQGWVTRLLPRSEGGLGEFVRCAGVRDPAQAGRATFEVRWRVAGRGRSRSFMTRALADSYRAELVRAARKDAAFDPATGTGRVLRLPVLRCAATGRSCLVPVAERHRRDRRGRRPRREQRTRPARHLPAPHRQPARPHQPADRRRSQC